MVCPQITTVDTVLIVGCPDYFINEFMITCLIDAHQDSNLCGERCFLTYQRYSFSCLAAINYLQIIHSYKWFIWIRIDIKMVANDSYTVI